jgi:hypothetical protein
VWLIGFSEKLLLVAIVIQNNAWKCIRELLSPNEYYTKSYVALLKGNRQIHFFLNSA